MKKTNGFWSGLWDHRYLIFALAMGSWFFTNALYLLASKAPVFTLAFVAQISLTRYLFLWAVLFTCFIILFYRPKRFFETYIPVLFSVFFYVTAILVKEMVLV